METELPDMSRKERVFHAARLEKTVWVASPRAILTLPRRVERWLEARVDHYLVASDQLVRFVRHPDYLLELLEHRRRHPLAERGRGMGGDAVLAIVGDADGNVEQLLRECVKRAGSHDGFQIFPGAFEENGIVSDRFPEIVDVVGLASRHDVVVHGFDLRAGVFVFDEPKSRHEDSPSCGNTCGR